VTDAPPATLAADPDGLRTSGAPQPASTLDTALAMYQEGFCVIRAKANGTKSPWGIRGQSGNEEWKHWQHQRPDEKTVRTWFSGGHAGIGIITGAVSGNLEMFEFEGKAIAEGVMDRMRDLACNSGQADLWDKVMNGYREDTPSGGIHLLYRTEQPVQKNTKLAQRPETPEELDGRDPSVKETAAGVKTPRPVVLIETRGEGGFTITSPSHGKVHPSGRPWNLVTGSLATIPTLTAEEHANLFTLARACDQMPLPEPRTSTRTPGPTSDSDGTRPGDDYNARTEWDDILVPHGWRLLFTRGSEGFWCRPGKDYGVSATTNHNGGGCLYVFTTSTDFTSEESYTKFGAYAHLEHGGSTSAAAKALRGIGYGTQPEAKAKAKVPKARDAPETPMSKAADEATYGLTTNLQRIHELDIHRGQLRMAGRFVDQWKDHLRFVHGIGWHQWDTTRWAVSKDGGPVRCAVRTARDAMREAAGLEKPEREELFTDIRRVESAAGLRGVLEIASNIKPLACSPDRLDTDPYLFNTANGTYDLRTGTIRPHDPNDLITKIAGCGYDPDAVGDTWTKFIAEVLPDEALRGFVQRLFGYSLLGKVREHMLPQFTGTGRNGKGTMRDVVKAAFGEYAIEVNPSIVMSEGARNHPTERADLLGARLVFTSETDDSQPLAAATMKRLVGGDPIRARRMGKDFFEFDPSHTLVMITNHLPAVAGDDKAVWARLRVVPFEQDFTDRQDAGLGDRLALDLPAVLAWCIEGYQLYFDGGLTEPDAVTKSTAEYHDRSDPLGRFMTEATNPSPHAFVRASELYDAWRNWCHESGEKELGKLSNVKFAEMLKRKGIGKESRAFGNVYVGLGLYASEDGESE
jgi:P4 family phage/plasmid primase-like protien